MLSSAHLNRQALSHTSCRVDRTKYQIQIPLPPKIDPSVTMMTVEEKPDVTYSDIGGCKEQIEKMREVVELPMLHPEKFVQLGIDPPKGVLCYGPPGTGKTLLVHPSGVGLCACRAASWLFAGSVLTFRYCRAVSSQLCAQHLLHLREQRGGGSSSVKASNAWLPFKTAQLQRCSRVPERRPGQWPTARTPAPAASPAAIWCRRMWARAHRAALSDSSMLQAHQLQTQLLPIPLTVTLAQARAVANRTDACFIRVIGSELVQKYVGEGARMVRELFQMARSKKACLIFFDEVDAIGGARHDDGAGVFLVCSLLGTRVLGADRVRCLLPASVVQSGQQRSAVCCTCLAASPGRGTGHQGSCLTPGAPAS